jgi:hypothetical protein
MLNFLCIGAQKSGTTWLHDTLRLHPLIDFPAGKEVHYWDHRAGRSVDWYRGLFTQSQRLEGDITPAYAILAENVIREVRQNFPALRLVYLIRNPMARAWSSARMALARAEMKHEEASDQWFVDHFRSAGSLARGDYEGCLRRWRAVFGEEQLLVLRYEAIVTSPVATANQVLRHLALPAFFDGGRPERRPPAVVFEGDGMPLRPSLLPALRAIYLDRIDRLEDYLQDDLAGWRNWTS